MHEISKKKNVLPQATTVNRRDGYPWKMGGKQKGGKKVMRRTRKHRSTKKKRTERYKKKRTVLHTVTFRPSVSAPHPSFLSSWPSSWRCASSFTPSSVPSNSRDRCSTASPKVPAGVHAGRSTHTQAPVALETHCHHTNRHPWTAAHNLRNRVGRCRTCGDTTHLEV